MEEFNRLGVGFSPIRDTLGINSNISLRILVKMVSLLIEVQ